MTGRESLARAMAKFSPGVRTIANSALATLRARLPGATELVYDNYNGLVVGFSPTDRPSDAVFSVVLYPRWVNLFFLDGALLDDPDRVLRGSGSRVRNIKLTATSDLDAAPVRALIAQALANADVPFDAKRRRRLEIRTESARQRPRRPGTAAARSGRASRRPR